MERYNDRATLDTGTAVQWVENPTAAIYDSGTPNLSIIYDDEGITLKSNPFTGNIDGTYFFYAADGKYDILLSGGTPVISQSIGAILLDDTLSLTNSAPGITQLNGLTGAYQGLSVGLSGSSPNVSSTGNTHTINLPIASGSKTGVLSSADWMSFSGKQDVIPLGVSTQYIRGDHTLNTLNTDNVPEGSGNLYYSNTRARLALSATAPILYNNSTGVVSSNPATAGQNGYLQAADFIIFNNKMGTLNGLSDVTQSFSTDSGGTDFAISSAAAYHTFKLPSASSTARGLITTGPQTINGPKTFASETYHQKYIEVSKISDLTNAGANQARIYLRDNGAGKMQLVVIFPSGALQQIALEP